MRFEGQSQPGWGGIMQAFLALRRLSLVSAISLSGILLLASPASGAYPGENGRIVFTSTRSGDAQIWSMRPDGSDQVQLTHVPSPALAAFPDTSPDGRHIAFTSNVSGELEIYTIDPDGSHMRRIVRDPKAADFTPRFSPDGERILFYRCQGDVLSPFEAQSGCNLFVVNLDGEGRMTRLTRGQTIQGNGSYSPDGSRIVFESNRKGALDAIWVMHADGTKLRRLTPKRMQAAWADWSPDGSMIVFMDNCCRAHSSIWVMKADGTAMRRITNPPYPHNDIFPAFSPNVKKIVFMSDRGSPDFSQVNVYEVSLRGTELERVAKDIFPTFNCDFCGPSPDWGAN